MIGGDDDRRKKKKKSKKNEEEIRRENTRELTTRSRRRFRANRAHAPKLLVHPRTYPPGRARRKSRGEEHDAREDPPPDRRFEMQPSGTRRRPGGENGSFGSRGTWEGNGRAESNEGTSREQFQAVSPNLTAAAVSAKRREESARAHGLRHSREISR